MRAQLGRLPAGLAAGQVHNLGLARRLFVLGSLLPVGIIDSQQLAGRRHVRQGFSRQSQHAPARAHVPHPGGHTPGGRCWRGTVPDNNASAPIPIANRTIENLGQVVINELTAGQVPDEYGARIAHRRQHFSIRAEKQPTERSQKCLELVAYLAGLYVPNPNRLLVQGPFDVSEQAAICRKPQVVRGVTKIEQPAATQRENLGNLRVLHPQALHLLSGLQVPNDDGKLRAAVEGARNKSAVG